MSAPRWWVLAFALAGCLRTTSHHCSDEQACGVTGFCEPTGFCSFADSDCPDGRRYGEGAGELSGVCVGDEPDPDAGPDGDPARDRDLDGVLDGVDNCPEVANTEQTDEDGDARGDVCDNCPHVPNAAQLDIQETIDGVTADGVGDDCDPAPQRGGDRIVLFDGFAGTETPEWNTTGIWTRDEGAMFVTASSSPSLLTIEAPNPGTTYVVLTATTPMSVMSGDLAAGVGVIAGASPLPLGGTVCAVINESGAGATSVRVMELPGGEAQSSSAISGAFIAARHRLTFEFSAQASQLPRPCQVLRPSSAATAQLRDVPGTNGSHVGLYAHRVNTQFEYLLVIATAPD